VRSTEHIEPNHPDGLTLEAINALLHEAHVHWAMAPRPTSGLLDGTAAERRVRRINRRAMGAVVRALPIRPAPAMVNDEAA